MNFTFSTALKTYLLEKGVSTLTVRFSANGCCSVGHAKISILPGIHFYDTHEFQVVKSDGITLCIQDLVHFTSPLVSFDVRKVLGFHLIEAEGFDENPDFSRRFA